MENGTKLPRTPKLEFLPPKKLEVSREKDAAEATSKMLAKIPSDIAKNQILRPLGVNKERIDCKRTILVLSI